MYDSDESSVESPELGSYKEILESNKSYNFNYLAETPFINNAAVDVEGRPIIRVVTNCIEPTRSAELVATRYAVKMMHPIISQESYTFIGCLSNIGLNNLVDSGLTWIKDLFSLIPKIYRKRLKKMYLIHPSMLIQMSMTMSAPFIPAKFWYKLQSSSTLSEVLPKILSPENKEQLFPRIVHKAEALQNKQEPLPALGVSLHSTSLYNPCCVRNCKNIPETLLRLVQALEHPDVIITRDLFDHSPRGPELYTVIDVLEDGDWQFNMTPHVAEITAAFRLYLRCLPQPLLGESAFLEFFDLGKSVDFRPLALSESTLYGFLKQKLASAPFNVSQTICFLLIFFRHVVELQRINKTTCERIATVFASAFSRPSRWNFETPLVFPIVIRAISLMIDKPYLFFPQHEELKYYNEDELNSVKRNKHLPKMGKEVENEKEQEQEEIEEQEQGEDDEEDEDENEEEDEEEEDEEEEDEEEEDEEAENEEEEDEEEEDEEEEDEEEEDEKEEDEEEEDEEEEEE